MKTLNSKNGFDTHKQKSLRVYLFLLFFIFSALVLGVSYSISQYLITSKTEKKLQENLNLEFNSKQELIKCFTNSKQNYLDAIRSYQLIPEYFQNPNKYDSALTDYFLSIAKTSSDIMQLRVLDKEGFEKIKIIRNSQNDQPLSLNKIELQNKSQRYYFKEALNLKPYQLWFSKIDLNIEHGKIELPIIPTMRILYPIYKEKQFQGVIIINFFMEKFLQNLTNSLHFNIDILDDSNEYILHHTDPTKNWSAHFNDRNSFFEEFDIVDNKLYNPLTNKSVPFFKKEIKELIPNNKLSLIFSPKEHTFTQIQNLQEEYFFYLFILISLIAIPISILLTKVLFNYTKGLLESKHRLLELVNDHVLYSSSDLEGNITDVSEALCKLTKYERSELIGQNHNIFRHPENPDIIFQNMWSTLLKGHIWSGELKNIDKEHNTFWIDVTISPNFENNELVGFTAIRDNITDKKIIEALSVTDELTTLYNKRFFNKTFPREIKRAKRLKTYFVFVILDIDNFKLYNDTYGHKEGDYVLQEVGVLIRKLFKRSNDFPFRIGGEEFAMIFTEKEESKIYPFIEQIRKSIYELNIEHKNNGEHKVITASIGYKVMHSTNILSETEIYKQADKALYRAKKSGRNKVINYDKIDTL